MGNPQKMFVFLLFMFTSFSSTLYADDCLEKRYVFELGSGTTRMTTYLFNNCQGNIIKEMEHLSRKMAYQNCVAKSVYKKVDDNCIRSGIATINEMKKLYNIDCKTNKCTGFATAWARKASNTADVLKQVESKTDVHVYAISQEEEAKMGYSVTQEILLHNGDITPDEPDILLIDVGAGSYQIATMDPKTKKSLMYKGNTGTEILTGEMKVRFPQKKASMVECSSLNEIYNFYDRKVKKALAADKDMISFLKEHPNIKAYGVGGGIASGLAIEFAFKNPVKISDIEKINKEICGLSFDEVVRIYPKGKLEYMKTTQAMFFLLHSIMKGLGVKELNMATGVNPSYYVVKNGDYWGHLNK